MLGVGEKGPWKGDDVKRSGARTSAGMAWHVSRVKLPDDSDEG